VHTVISAIVAVPNRKSLEQDLLDELIVGGVVARWKVKRGSRGSIFVTPGGACIVIRLFSCLLPL
jgi:hypothetical protein